VKGLHDAIMRNNQAFDAVLLAIILAGATASILCLIYL